MPKKKKKRPQLLANLLIFALIRSPKTPSDIINRAYAIYYWRRCKGKKSRIKIIIKFLLSPIHIIKDIINTSKKYAQVEDIRVEKGRLRRFIEEFYLAFFYAISSEDYYIQRFFKKDGLKRAKYYVSKGILKHAVYKLLLKYGLYKNPHHKKIYSLGNKEIFFEFCTKKNLKTIPVEMQFFSDGTVKSFTGEEDLPEKDIFIKPTIDNEGRGAESWFWKGAHYENVHGESIDKASLEKHIKKSAKTHSRGSILIQPLILPHKDLSPFRKNASPTIRILTYRNKKDEIRIGPGMFRFSLDESSVVDNASAGGVMAPIDMKDGLLGTAMYSDVTISNEPIDQLPNGQGRIKGTRIPYWKETLSLVKKAHKYFPERYMVGWDILITDEGPILVEGNAQSGIDFIQRTHGKSIGQYKIGKALAKHVQRATKTLYSGKLRKDSKDKAPVDIYNGSTLKRWLNWVFIRQRTGIEIIIHGKVQRVGYRRWLKERAKTYKITGWCKNCPDKTLKAKFYGKSIDVEDLYRECYRGPDRARVDRIEVKKIKDKNFKGFKIIR